MKPFDVELCVASFRYGYRGDATRAIGPALVNGITEVVCAALRQFGRADAGNRRDDIVVIRFAADRAAEGDHHVMRNGFLKVALHPQEQLKVALDGEGVTHDANDQFGVYQFVAEYHWVIRFV